MNDKIEEKEDNLQKVRDKAWDAYIKAWAFYDKMRATAARAKAYAVYDEDWNAYVRARAAYDKANENKEGLEMGDRMTKQSKIIKSRDKFLSVEEFEQKIFPSSCEQYPVRMRLTKEEAELIQRLRGGYLVFESDGKNVFLSRNRGNNKRR